MMVLVSGDCSGTYGLRPGNSVNGRREGEEEKEGKIPRTVVMRSDLNLARTDHADWPFVSPWQSSTWTLSSSPDCVLNDTQGEAVAPPVNHSTCDLKIHISRQNLVKG